MASGSDTFNHWVQGPPLMIVMISAAFLVNCTTRSPREPHAGGAELSEPLKVIKIIDGDTIRVANTLGGLHWPATIRLAYIDTPEIRSNAHGPASPDGPKAKAFLEGFIPVGSTVRLLVEGDRLKRDGFGRVIAIVQVGDTTAQEALIAAGWSPYWTEHGEASQSWHNRFTSAMTNNGTGQ